MRGGGGGAGYGSIVDAGPVLLALTPASELIVLEANPKAFVGKASFKVSSSPVHAHPVVSGNQIYIKDADSIIAYSL
jgi:outer membrane protein assembly factor BamB